MKKKERWMNKFLVAVLLVSVLLGFSLNESAVIIVDPSQHFTVENETYRVNSTMVFDQIIVGSTYIIFNSTRFDVSSLDPVTITVVFLAHDVAGSEVGDQVLEFSVTTTADAMRFNLSGFPRDTEYEILQDGDSLVYRVADSSGILTFSSSTGGTQRFQIFRQTGGSGEEPSEDGYPFAVFLYQGNASVNQTIVFNASGSYDPDGVILSYQWDFGDGATATGELVTHAYTAAGQYTVSLTVTDNTGWTNTANQIIRVSSAGGVSGETSGSFWDVNGPMILVLFALVVILGFFVAYHNKIQDVFSPSGLRANEKQVSPLERDTALEVDALVDSLFSERKDRVGFPLTDTVLDASNEVSVREVDKNNAVSPPDRSIDEVEKLVDDRKRAKHQRNRE